MYLCYILGFLKHILFVVEFCLIVLVGICKLYCLLKPLSHSLTTTIVVRIVTTIWVLSIAYVSTWPSTSYMMVFDPISNICMPWLKPIANYIFLGFHFLVMFAIIVTNVVILLVAMRRSEDGVKKATLTVSMICWVFVASYGPWLGYWSLVGAGRDVPAQLITVGMMSMQINLLANPFIYSFTNKR